MAEYPLFVFVVCLLVISAYCLPTIIAFSRGHPNRYLIAVVNIAGGLTGFGWLLALLWSMHAIHRNSDEDGSYGGESGLNIGVNDVAPVRLINPDLANQLSDLKRLLDEGVIDQADFTKLKAKIIG